MTKVSLVSLGCPKNLVDSEGALGELVQAGHELVIDQSSADVIIVNTCGFIESAREESIEAILGALEHKESGGCKAVIVMGCLS
ncbi:30S ribosomal protein S12 methylthiotransferase RimO, partial [bacterium]|nr:30S ribosomal protein S12 methylthiotransferase RimO [bacterium]